MQRQCGKNATTIITGVASFTEFCNVFLKVSVLTHEGFGKEKTISRNYCR